MVAAPAPAAPPAPSREEVVGSAALARIGYPWQETGFTVRFLPERPGYLGMTYMEGRRIEVYVRPSQGVDDVARVLAHELGHAVDLAWATGEKRSAYLQARGLDPSTPWYGCNRCRDFATPAGDWSETFAWWVLGPGAFRSELAPPPSDAELERIAPLFLPPR